MRGLGTIAMLCALTGLLAAPSRALEPHRTSAPISGPISGPAPEPSSDARNAASDGLMSRIDFGNAYVMGQTIQSGAVYLLNRKQSEVRSMLESRKEYRREIREDAEILDPKHTR